MRQKLLNLCLTIIMMVVCVATWALSEVNGAYQIGSVEDLIAFAEIVNCENPYANAVLTTDIAFNDVWETPIGTAEGAFAGTFDGQGHKITGFNGISHGKFGLFGCINSATVQNFSIAGKITAYSADGESAHGTGAIGWSESSHILNVHSALNIDVIDGNVHHVGGVVGSVNYNNHIKGCSFSGTLKDEGFNTDCFGGVAGYTANDTIMYCANYGTISFKNVGAYAGGIAGYLNNTDGTIMGCLSVGKLIYMDESEPTYGGAIIGRLRNNTPSRLQNNVWIESSGYKGTGENSVPSTVCATVEQLASGEICYYLNCDQTEIGWYQTLGTDEMPVFNATHKQVYMNRHLHCNNDVYEGATYSNENIGIIQDEHDIVDGICSYCGLFDEDFFTPNADGFYEIASARQLVWFEQKVNKGAFDASAVLTADIDLAEISSSWMPIGSVNNPYAGTFDGQGYKLTGFMMKAAFGDRLGLFGNVMVATIQNFSIDGNITYCGGTGVGVVGWAESSTIRNVHSSLNIVVIGEDSHHVGGICGSLRSGSTASGCSFSGTITETAGNNDCIGGIGAYSNGYCLYENCANYGTITFSAPNTYAGGICGYVNNDDFYGIKNCLNVGKVQINNGTPDYSGAIVGRLRKHANSVLDNNYWLDGSAIQVSGENTLEATSVTAAQLACGEICYALNGDQTEINWHQTLGEDNYPIPDNTHKQVYVNGRLHCNGDVYEGATYSNEDTGIILDEHDIIDGICSYCGFFDENFLTLNADGFYEIANAKQLIWFEQKVNKGKLDANAVLTADIDFSELGEDVIWTPIGDWGATRGVDSAGYCGHFDGQGHKIMGFNVTTNQNYFGFFGVLTEGALIEGFTIYGTLSNDTYKTGGIVGYTRDTETTIHDIHSYLNINNTLVGGRYGGIVGTVSNGTTNIENCTYSGVLDGNDEGDSGNYGGLVGYVNNSTAAVLNISNCLFDGQVINTNATPGGCTFGGFVGYCNSGIITIKNCLSIGTVKSTVWGMYSGAIKQSKSAYINCYYVGELVNGSASTVTIPAIETNSEELASGEICWKLNEEMFIDVAWYQTLQEDPYPVLDNHHLRVCFNEEFYVNINETSISISLPEGTNAQDYAQMWLELVNTKDDQRKHYVITDRIQYTFPSISSNTTWNAVLRNERGDVFGQIDNIEVQDEDVSVTFSSLSKPQSVVLSVLTPDRQDVTSQTQIIWNDAQGNYIAQAASLSGFPIGYQANYSIALSQELAMIYETPHAADYTLKDGDNNITCQLDSIKQVQISGKVKDAETGLPLSGAVISVSQTFGGKHTKTLTAKTDKDGVFTMEVSNVPTSLTYAATDYITQTVNYDNGLDELIGFVVPDVSLRPITGATITIDFTYTTCEGETQNWYSDYNNVSYTLYNITKQQDISQFNVQYPQIVLMEEVEDGDELKLTATSRGNAFNAVETTATIAEQKAEATFAIKELGRIQAMFTTSGNASVVGSLYDASGKLVKTYNYSNAMLTISGLSDGQYTLVSMGSSQLYNTIYDLAQLSQTGLAEGSDYVKNTVEVKSGAISMISIDEVPTLNESKLYYTGNNTSFTVNKPSIVVGNYIALTGHIDFKPDYASNVSNVNLIVDLPESCEFVENSVIVGNSTNSYTLNGSRITIPMTNYTDRVLLCVIPTLGGDYAPSAFAQFNLDGETITQPIGSANYTAKDLSINVPSMVARTAVPISGTAKGTSNIEIYDNGVLIGQTTSLANGAWKTTCELNEPYNLSKHQIYAKVTTNAGLELKSETMSCMYDKNTIEVKTVTMINTAHTAANLNLHDYGRRGKSPWIAPMPPNQIS